MIPPQEHIRRLIAATGKYELCAENTEGANAYAFLAHHLLLDQPVFLKVLDVMPNEDFLAEPRLLVEATKAAGDDGNLVRVYDAERLGSPSTEARNRSRQRISRSATIAASVFSPIVNTARRRTSRQNSSASA